MICKVCTKMKKVCWGCTQEIRKESGLCITCGELAVKGKRRCEVHRNLRNGQYNPAKKRQYYLENKPEILKAHAKYVKKKYKDDVQFRLRRNILSRIQDIMKAKNGKKKYSISKNMGCTYDELKQHLENEFYQHPETDEHMSWENYGIDGWHVDHILPLSLFNLEDKLQFRMANHYTNLKPRWAEENIKKTNELDDDSFLHTIQLEDGFYVFENVLKDSTDE